MSNTFQDFDLMKEFLDSEYYRKAVEQFKASKEPKKEWEIVAYSGNIGFGNRVYQLCNDGEYRWKGIIDKIPRSAENLLDKGCTVHSVRRLSDGEIFSVGDKMRGFATPITKIEVSDTWGGGIGLVCGDSTSGSSLESALKQPNPLFTTADGVEINPEDPNRIYPVDKDFGFIVTTLTEYNKDTWGNHKVFSTREAALEYIIQHKPCLSVEDVKGLLTKCLCDETVEQVTDFLTTLVKSKL